MAQSRSDLKKGKFMNETTKQEKGLEPVNESEPKIDETELNEVYKKAREYDVIINDYNALLKLSHEKGISVPELINSIKHENDTKRLSELTEKCNGDEELAKHILELESALEQTNDDFAEIKKFFPKFKDKGELPLSVTENARLRGTLLLDEYLRYLLTENLNTKNALKEQELRDRASTGSLTTRKSEINPEAAEFLRGLWK